MDTIKFANGDVYDCSFVSTVPSGGSNRAIIALPNVTFVEAAAVFSDTNMTQRIEWGGYSLVGYTNLIGLSVMPYGNQAILSGGHNERIS